MEKWNRNILAQNCDYTLLRHSDLKSVYDIYCIDNRLFPLQSIGEQVTSLLMVDDEVLNYVFTLLAHQKTFINACQLIEDMLQSRKEVLDLHRISEYTL